MRGCYATFLVLLFLMSSAGCAHSPMARNAAALESLEDIVDRINAMEEGPPGFAVVVADSDGTVLIRADGVLNVDSGVPVTPDSPFYIASMTKAYVGLLAATLHEDGVLDLDSRLVDYWPDATVEGVDISNVTLRDLLTHQTPFNVGMITFIESYVSDIPVSMYPVYLSKFGEVREPGFKYDNLGYNIYTAILEFVTGRNWRDWLQEKVLAPYALTRTSSQASVFDAEEVAWRHQWNGGEEWHALPPKTDPQMQSAGGMMTSPRDLGRWLTINLRNRQLPVFLSAQASYVDTSDDDGGEMVCSGYTLGWKECSFHGMRVLQHGGGYIGARSFMAMAPESGIAIGVLSNSDNAMGYLSMQVAEFYFAQIAGTPWSSERTNDTLALFAEKANKLLAGRLQRAGKDRGGEKWSGWPWNPEPGELSEYEGTYANDLLGTLVVRAAAGKLNWQLDGWRMELVPAVRDRFGGSLSPFEGLQQIDFERDDAGGIAALRWNEFIFVRSH